MYIDYRHIVDADIAVILGFIIHISRYTTCMAK